MDELKPRVTPHKPKTAMSMDELMPRVSPDKPKPGVFTDKPKTKVSIDNLESDILVSMTNNSPYD